MHSRLNIKLRVLYRRLRVSNMARKKADAVKLLLEALREK